MVAEHRRWDAHQYQQAMSSERPHNTTSFKRGRMSARASRLTFAKHTKRACSRGTIVHDCKQPATKPRTGGMRQSMMKGLKFTTTITFTHADMALPKPSSEGRPSQRLNDPLATSSILACEILGIYIERKHEERAPPSGS